MPRLADGAAEWLNCPRCDDVMLRVNCGGMVGSLSRRSVPLSHAVILARYGHPVINVWRGVSRWWVTEWVPCRGRPGRGRLYVPHDCLFRK